MKKLRILETASKVAGQFRSRKAVDGSLIPAVLIAMPRSSPEQFCPFHFVVIRSEIEYNPQTVYTSGVSKIGNKQTTEVAREKKKCVNME